MSHIAAVVAALTPLGYPVEHIWATSTAQQYIVLGYRIHDDDPESTPGGDVGFETPLRVTARAASPQGVGVMLTRIRAALDPLRTVDAGRAVTATFAGSEFIAADTDATDPTTNQHPYYGVDSYLVRSEPTA